MSFVGRATRAGAILTDCRLAAGDMEGSLRTLFFSAAMAALLAACSPPAQRDTTDASQAPPTAIACNDLTPDPSRQVAVADETAAAAAASDLRGGRIAPGAYDLVSAMRLGAATGWSGTRAVTLEVSETDANGVVFNWAGAEPGGSTDRWTASFTETPTARLTYTCGRAGAVDAAFEVAPNALTLRLQDGASGRLALVFQPRP